MTAFQRLSTVDFRPAESRPADSRSAGSRSAGSRPADFRPADSQSVVPNDADRRPTIACDIAWCDADGQARWDRRALPDTPEIVAALSSFARGTLLLGPDGPVAVEDLVPGDRVAVRGGGTVSIDWIGALGHRAAAPGLFRVAAHAFGASGPARDVLLGAGARVLVESPRCRALVGTDTAYAPVSAFEDGHRVAAIAPPGEVVTYGLACAGQEAVLAGGLAVGSTHPARALATNLKRSGPSDLARLFPQMSRTGGFGAARIPCLTMTEAQGLAFAGL